MRLISEQLFFTIKQFMKTITLDFDRKTSINKWSYTHKNSVIIFKERVGVRPLNIYRLQIKCQKTSANRN